ncbi:MAG: NADH-quinone oxidoreductase subunit L, partial [Bacteroidota bacterium]
MESLLPLIILLPLFGSALVGLLGFMLPSLRESESLLGGIATIFVAIPFFIVFNAYLGFHGEPIDFKLFSWMQAGNLDISFGYRLDQLSLLMAMIVNGVGALIHLYSIGYMHGDKGFYKFFAYLNLFIFAMNNLILGDNLAVVFLGWEGVGVCSYLLIGFWYEDMEKAKAAQKAFVANRIGDFALIVAMMMIFANIGSLRFTDILSSAGLEVLEPYSFWIALLVFIAATGKSAQIPLYVWLPDAMAGPTPVSALIHAATMVTSGIYLITRIHPVFLASPEVMVIVVIVAALTSIVAALIAVAQNDIKKVLAYSTVSQLGFMFMALGAGAFTTAIFHVMTHAFFKACLFLGSGSVIHAMEHMHTVEDPQDIRTMGGLRKYMPSTGTTFWISTLAIAGIPLFSGFFSKDEILSSVFFNGFENSIYFVVWVVATITAALTAF